jgi:hypothetical protein
VLETLATDLIRPFEKWHPLLPTKSSRHVLLDKGFLKKVKIRKRSFFIYIDLFICKKIAARPMLKQKTINVTTGGGVLVPNTSVLGSRKPITCSEVLNKKTVEKTTTEIQEKEKLELSRFFYTG